MVTPKQAAEIASRKLGRHISPSTIAGWIRSGKLPSKKIGGMRLIERKALYLFLAGESCKED